MDVSALIVHVPDPVRGQIVLHPRSRHLAAAPIRLAAAVGFARRCLTEDAPVEFGGDSVIVEIRFAVFAAPERHPVRRELG
jgi:hypothetical protein